MLVLLVVYLGLTGCTRDDLLATNIADEPGGEPIADPQSVPLHMFLYDDTTLQGIRQSMVSFAPWAHMRIRPGIAIDANYCDGARVCLELGWSGTSVPIPNATDLATIIPGLEYPIETDISGTDFEALVELGVSGGLAEIHLAAGS